MRCNICGYEDEKHFSVCPYCGEDVKKQNNVQNYRQNNVQNSGQNNVQNYGQNNVQNYGQNRVQNFVQNNNSPTGYNRNLGIPQNNISVPIVPEYNPNPIPNIANLPTTQPKGFVRTTNGFRININVDDGEFYHRYMFFNILGIVSTILLFIVYFTNINIDFEEFSCFFFICFFLFMSFFSLINHIYSTFMNKFTFEVNPNGISVKSPMKQYFIPRSNIKVSWFENISKMVDKFNYSSLFMSFFTRGRYGYHRRGLFDDILFGDSYNRRDQSDMFHNEKEFKRANNVFIEVENPIFANDTFASEDKRCKCLINTGLSFQSAAEARFVEHELRSVLNLPDIPVKGEYDYNVKMGITQRDTRTPFDRN